ncbi:MAG: MFS transporter [Alphaproteobacteria bacterium]|nr:MFS transporter [Alphaproteobacteria bacterium]
MSDLLATPASPSSIRPIALLSAAAFASAATLRVADPLIPQIVAEFGVTAGAAALVVATLFAASYGLAQIFVGPFGDRFGKYAVIVVATFLCAAMTAAAAFSNGLLALGATRLLSGAFAGAIIPLGIAYLGDVIPYERRQPVLARYLSGQILGVIAGQVFGGLFGDTIGWRGIFLALGAVYLTIGGLLWAELASPRVAKHRAPGGAGRDLATRYLLLLRDHRVRIVIATVFAEGFLFFGGFVYIGAYLRHAFGLSYAAVGLLLAGFGLGGLLYALAVKLLVTRLGERGLVLVGGAVLGTAMTLAAAAPAAWTFAPLTAAIGTGFYMHHNTLQTHATQMAPQARGMAISLFAFCYFLGNAAGVALFGAAIDRFGYAPGFIASGILLAALAVSYQRTLRR